MSALHYSKDILYLCRYFIKPCRTIFAERLQRGLKKEAKVSGVKGSSLPLNMNNATSKRERSVPPKSSVPTEKVREENFASDTELIGSPKKRKKTAVFERGNLLEKAAEIGKVVWDAGTKLGNLFKSSSKPGKESGDCKADFESESVTSCEATTSFQDDKPKSSSSPPRADLIADANDENDEDFQHTPELKTIGRSVTWDVTKRSNVVEELLKGSEIRSWSGDRSTLERKLGTEPRKRSAGDDLDAEMDAGKVKKVKKHREEPKAYKWDKNPLQVRNLNLYLFQEGLHFKCRLF